MTERVVILGGGVAGLSAAHELSERGFAVTVYEKKAIAGGKARSLPVPDSGKDGRKPLPAEHGFRFFPGFYRHLPETMSRIPYGDAKNGVLDNLVDTTRELIGRPGHQPLSMLPRFPHSLSDLELLLSEPKELAALKIPPADVRFFADRLWQILTSCQERRLLEYERLPWWTFVEADTRSQPYREFMAIGATRTLVAAKAELASTKTIGDIALQLLFNMASPRVGSDRVLNGPTNEVFIDPWVSYLTERGVSYQRETVLQAINMAGGRIASVTVSQGGRTEEVEADFFLCCLPVEVTARFLTPAMLKVDPVLEGITKLQTSVSWMNGIQYYLKEDVPIVHGHEMFLDSPWSVTSISQAQFWPRFDWSRHGDGTVNGVLSVDLSNWDAPGVEIKKPARDCTPEEIARETWGQIVASVNVGQTVLDWSNVHSWFVDPDIQNLDDNPSEHVNAEPLLVNLVNTWPLRPNAFTEIPNFFLASDYVRTNTDLASMEGANEAARRAVNAILDASKSSAHYAKVYDLHEPDVLAAWRMYDRHRFERGLKWDPNPVGTAGRWLRGVGHAVGRLFDRD